MDRTFKRPDHRRTAVRVAGLVPLELVLQEQGRQPTESAVDAIDRRAVYAETVFRLAEDHRLAAQAGTPGEPQASRTADADNGAGGDLSEASAEQARARPSNLSIPSSEYEGGAAESGMVYGHNLCAAGPGICLFSGNYRLVQPVRAGVGDIDDARYQLLRLGLGVGSRQRSPSRDLQHRSRLAVHQRPVHRAADRALNSDQHGRKGPGLGQCVCRTSLAHGQIRRDLFERLSQCRNRGRATEAVLRVLQLRAPASIARVQNAGRSLSKPTTMRRLGVGGVPKCASRESMSFLRHLGDLSSDERMRGRNRVRVTPSLIVLMSLRLAIPGGLPSGRACFRFTSRSECATRRDRLQGGATRLNLMSDPGIHSELNPAPAIGRDLSLKEWAFLV
jgi:hypothetical protein